MEIASIGLILNFLGALLLGVSTQFGISLGGTSKPPDEVTWIEGLETKLAFKNHVWRFCNAMGWILLSLGFLLQVLCSIEMPFITFV